MKKLFNFIFNVLWFIFGGLINAIYCLIQGIVTTCLIIPIFFGIPLVYFRALPLCFAPAGKKVETNFGSAAIRNVLYLIFGGLFTIVGNYLYACLLCATIIGIPLGLQQLKFAKFFVAPFGAKVTPITKEETKAIVNSETK